MDESYFDAASGYYGTGRRPPRPSSRITALLAVAVLIVIGNLVAVVVLRERMENIDPTNGLQPPALSDALASDPTQSQTEPSAAEEVAFPVGEAAKTEISNAQIYRKVAESLVTLVCDTQRSLGIIFRADGYILAGFSAAQADDVRVVTRDAKVYPAVCVGADEASDLAVFRIDATNLPAAEFADASALSREQSLFTFTFAQNGQVQMRPAVFCDTAEVSLSGQTVRLLQFDAEPDALGPLVNGAGQIVGFAVSAVGSNVSFGSARRVAYALSAQELGSIAAELIRFGCVPRRATLGIRVCEMDEPLRRYWHLPEGVLIEQIDEGSNAALAGIEQGDVIVQIGELNIRGISDYREALNRCVVGQTVRVTIYRRGAQYSALLLLRAQTASPENSSKN